ncbi:hypothetical protein BDF14DRAFT_379923 [Spinellus fusiger]|nr:hypothetical protein BDF14DRAFT_379923 [Spinellus fusiger]
MDAALITTDQRVRNLVRRFTRDELLNIVEAMEHVQKSKVIDRLLNVDWTEGLCALQVAQLDLKYTLLHPAFKKWQLWRLKAGKSNEPYVNNQQKERLMVNSESGSTSLPDIGSAGSSGPCAYISYAILSVCE